MTNTETRTCPQCGAPLEANATVCKYCGTEIQVQPSQEVPQYAQPQTPQAVPQYAQSQTATQYAQPQAAPQYAQPQAPQNIPPQTLAYQQTAPVYNPNVKTKSKVAAGLLAIFLGGLGIHKFYLGKYGMGFLYLLFCWTYIPEVVGIIEGIIYLSSSDEKFYLKYVKK